MKFILISLLATAIGQSGIYNNLNPFSFEENWSRYPSAQAILNKVKAVFPWASPSDPSDKNSASARLCAIVDRGNREVLGVSDPLLGEPIFKEPSVDFVEGYSNCLYAYMSSDNDVMFSIIFVEPFSNELARCTRWETCPVELKRKYALFLIESIYGPVLQNPEPFVVAVIERGDDFSRQNPTDRTLMVYKHMIHELMMRDAFLMIGWLEEISP